MGQERTLAREGTTMVVAMVFTTMSSGGGEDWCGLEEEGWEEAPLVTNRRQSAATSTEEADRTQEPA